MDDQAPTPPDPPAPDGPHPTLCVDLDGTLVATDTMFEATLMLLRSRPWTALRIPLWLLQGRAVFKKRLAEHLQIDAAALPYDPNVLDFIREARSRGQTVVLATATDIHVARRVADHLGLIDDVIATDGDQNLRGSAKLEAIRARIGDGAFEYIGDSPVDLPVWAGARTAHLVNPSDSLLSAARRISHVGRVFLEPGRPGRAVALLGAMRPHQWVKNLLLAVPMCAGHAVGDPLLWLVFLAAFVVFSLCASSVYVFNDLLDLSADRQHPVKKRRPFAAGVIPLHVGVVSIPLLLVAAFVLALIAIPRQTVGGFVLALGAYSLMSAVYSLWAKGRPVIDVLVLAALYTLRIIAGGAATGIDVSPWLLAFAMFIFLSLAFAKRFAELTRVADQDGRRAEGRGYLVEDMGLIGTSGIVSGYLAVMVICLYIQSTEVKVLYDRPTALWLAVPLLLYWVTRLWLLVHRKQISDDPVYFAMTDRVTYGIAGAMVAIVLLAAV